MVQNGSWTLRDDGLYHNPDGEELKLTISPRMWKRSSLSAITGKGRTITASADAWQPEGYDELCRLNVCTNVPGAPLMMMTAGHLTPGFPKNHQHGICPRFAARPGLARRSSEQPDGRRCKPVHVLHGRHYYVRRGRSPRQALRKRHAWTKPLPAATQPAGPSF